MSKKLSRPSGKTQSGRVARGSMQLHRDNTLKEPIRIRTILDMGDEDIVREIEALRASIITREERRGSTTGGHGGLIPTPGQLSARRVDERMSHYRLDELLLAQKVRHL
jgi:hypothetical protein